MIIESLHIDCFGCLQDFSCTFDSRLNIIEGDNEAGKSTLAAFVRYMLYGFGRAGGTELAEKKKRINWEKGRAAGSMTVRVGDRRYRIERSTTLVTGPRGKDTYRETGTLIDLGNRMPLSWNDQKTPGERFLGVPEAVFLSTAFVPQVSARIGGGELTEAIENLLFSGDESLNVQRALDKLEGLRRTLLHKSGRGGALYDLATREADVKARMAQAEKDNGAIFEKESALATVKRQLATAEKKQEEVEMHEKQEEAALLLVSYRRLHEAEHKLAEAEAALKNLDGLPAYRLHEGDLTDLALAGRTAKEAKARYLEAKQAREGYSGTGLDKNTELYLEKAQKGGGTAGLRALSETKKKHCMLTAVGGGCIAFAGLVLLILVLILPTAFGDLLALPYTLGSLLLLAGGGLGLEAYRVHRALTALYSLYGVKEQTEFLSRMDEIDRGREQVHAYRGAAKEAYDTETKLGVAYNRAVSELDTVVGRFGTRLPEENVEEFLNTLAETARRVMEKKKVYEAKVLSAQDVVDALSAQLIGTNEAAARAILPPDCEIRVEDVQLEEWRKQKDYFASQARILSRHVGELERELAALRARAQDPALLQAEWEALRDHSAAVREQHEACVMAYEAISGAGERLRAEISPRLSDFACRMMEELTDGRYRRIGIGSDLAVSVGTGDGTYSLDYLSAGTQDLSYLSLRMALIDLLYKEKPPVFFDESFAHQDNDRTERILRTLAERSAEGQQNLIFTCHTRESEMARRVAPEAAVIRMPSVGA